MKVVNFVFFTVCVVIAAADTKLGRSTHQITCKTAAERQFPYQASLQQNTVINPGNHSESGAIITNRHILTWATFGENQTPVYTHAVVGLWRLDKVGIRMELDAIYSHQRVWSERYRHNIAVVKTKKEIIFNDYVQPIALPTQPLPPQGNVSVVLSGWRLNSNGNVRQNLFDFYA